MVPMIQPLARTPFSVRQEVECDSHADAVVQVMQDVITARDGARIGIEFELLPGRPNPSQSASFSFCVTPHESGGVALTCPELPDLLVIGDTDEEALAMALDAIQMWAV